MELSTSSNLRHGWAPPPELRRSQPRPVRLTGNGIGMLVMGLVFVPGGVAILIALILTGRHEQALVNRMGAEGRQIEATVTRRWTDSGYRATHNLLRYQFTAEGKSYSRTAEVDYSLWSNTKVGSRLPVLFLPSDPSVNYLPKYPTRITPLWLAIFMSAIFLLPGLALLFGVRRQWRLLKYGIPAAAVVTRTRTVKAKYGRTSIGDYEFPLAGGTAKSRGSAAMIHREGWVFSVVYDPKKPRRNSPYPLPTPVFVKMALPDL